MLSKKEQETTNRKRKLLSAALVSKERNVPNVRRKLFHSAKVYDVDVI